jgi:hypothetical protein
MTTALEPRQDIAPVNLGHAFDLALPLADRCDAMLSILELAAALTVERDERVFLDAGEDNPYADEDFRRQETKRRTLKGACDLRQVANILELKWVMQNGGETWVDADGAEVDLLSTIEHQMPNEEQRKSSGRARELWMFAAGKHSAIEAFREQGICDQEIARVATSGMSSVYGIVASYRKKLEEVTPPDELQETYEELIEAAAETTNLDTLRKKCRQMVDPTDTPPPPIDPTDTPPPPIRYSVEPDGDDWWFVACPSRDQWTELVLRRLKDVLEIDKLLPEAFARYWREGVPVGRT